jgi:hypothetical protein
MRFASQAAQALSRSALVELSLRGRHFPTQATGSNELATLSGAEILSLRLQGSFLLEQEVVDLVASLPRLRCLDLAGADVTLAGLEKLGAILRRLHTLRLGYAPPSGSDHRFTPTLHASRVPDVIGSLTGLKSLSVRGLDVSDEVAEIACFATLERLDLGETRVSDATVARLATSRHVRRLLLDQTGITDAGCAKLAGASNLVSLDLGGTQAGSKTLDALVSLDALGYLGLSQNPYGDDFAPKLARLRSLQSLDLSYTRASALTVKALAALPMLRTLNLMGCRLNAGAMEACRDLASLTFLTASCDGPPWPILASLEPLKELEAPLDNLERVPRHLVKLHGRTSLPAGADFSSAERLESLFVRGGASALIGLCKQALPRLREFGCQSADVTDQVLVILAARPAIEALYVSGNSFTDVGLRAFRGADYVHTLELRDVDLRPDVIQTLVSLPRLHCLDLPGTGLSDRDVAGLIAAQNLQSLALDPDQITDVSMGALARCPTLVELYVYKTALTPGKVKLIARLPTLHELNLMDVHLTEDLAAEIAVLPALRMLRTAARDPAATARLVNARPDLRLDPPAGSKPNELTITARGRRSAQLGTMEQ